MNDEYRATLPRDDFDYSTLDPGIVETVRKLRANGFETVDSGDGVSKGPPGDGVLDYPHVFSVCAPAHLARLAHSMAAILPADWVVEASYSTKDKTGILFAYRDEAQSEG